MAAQRRRGRPSDYCAEIAMTICDRLADGESLRAICADAGMPDKATVFRWIGRHKAFRNQYALLDTPLTVSTHAAIQRPVKLGLKANQSILNADARTAVPRH